jgi:hypothetical protein
MHAGAPDRRHGPGWRGAGQASENNDVKSGGAVPGGAREPGVLTPLRGLHLCRLLGRVRFMSRARHRRLRQAHCRLARFPFHAGSARPRRARAVAARSKPVQDAGLTPDSHHLDGRDLPGNSLNTAARQAVVISASNRDAATSRERCRMRDKGIVRLPANLTDRRDIRAGAGTVPTTAAVRKAFARHSRKRAARTTRYLVHRRLGNVPLLRILPRSLTDAA